MTLHAPGARVAGVGIAAERPDVPPKVDGTFVFANDLVAPDMVFAATVRSPHAHARVVAVDAAAALTRPGVLTVLTQDDVPGDLRIGHIVADQPVFADGVVRYQGEPVAMVVAATQEEAWRAATEVTVAYDPRPVLDDPAHVLADDAPQLHANGNLYRRLHLRQGDLGAAERVAAVVVDATWETGRQDQAFLGPESALALPDPDGGVTLHVATQDLHTDQRQIAAALALPVDRVRVVLAGIGGAFGGREDITLQVHLCLAALRLGRPVKTTYRRGESFLAHPKRHPARMRYRVGADRDGRLRFVDASLLLDGGAYASTSGPVIGTAAYFAAGPYRVDAVDIRAESVATNNPVCGAMRGFGAVQACFGIESTLDLLADRLGMDPVDLRRRNALRPGDRFPTSGQRCGPSTPVREVIDVCAALPLPDPAPAGGPAPARGPASEGGPASEDPYRFPGGTGATTRGEGVRRGVGFAVGVKQMLYGEGVPEWSEAVVRVTGAGVEAVSAAAECGQGIAGVVTQVVREHFGGDVPVRTGPASTEAGYAGSSSASRQTWMASAAVSDACRRALAELAVRGWEPGARALADVVGDDVVECRGRYDAPPTVHGDPTAGAGDVHVSWMFVAHRAVVDVDVELGLVKVVQVATAQDVGLAANPREVGGQIDGGIAQGVGLAALEHLDTVAGLARNVTFTDYLIPTVADMPDVVADAVEIPEPLAPFGLKGVGEPPVLSSTPAIVSAVRRATGRPVRRVPIRPDDLVL